MHKDRSLLILLRHGQSEWNKKNLFTGWVDIPLSELGVKESFEAGKEIAKLPVDRVFTSELIRAQMTAFLALLGHPSGRIPVRKHQEQSKMGQWGKIYQREVETSVIPVETAWELNERMYGKLQGLNKEEVKKEFGEAQFKTWRRSFRGAPPEGESLAMTAERTLPYFKEKIFPHIAKGENILIAAHGNSLRALIMDLEKLTEEEVLHLELETGKPLVYAWNEKGWEKR